MPQRRTSETKYGVGVTRILRANAVSALERATAGGQAERAAEVMESSSQV